MLKAIVFDFDGVIVKNSEFVKRDSWKGVFPELGDTVFEIIDPLIKKYFGGKGSRFDIIKDVLVDTLGIKNDLENKIASYAKKYNELVQDGIISLGVEKVDKEALDYLSKKIPIFLNSATPTDAILYTAQRLGIDKNFKKILGHNNKPTSKVDNLNLVIEAENITANELLFVGDSDTDRKAAEEVGVQFVGIANQYNKWSENNSDIFNSIHGILDLI